MLQFIFNRIKKVKLMKLKYVRRIKSMWKLMQESFLNLGVLVSVVTIYYTTGFSVHLNLSVQI